MSQRTSILGACLTIVFVIITLLFTYSKTNVLLTNADVTVMGSSLENAFTPDFQFTAEHGLFVAAALTAYDSENEVIEEARYGELTIEMFGWGNGGDSIGSDYTDIEYDWCTGQ